MSRPIVRACVLLPLTLFIAGCDSNDTGISNPDAPTPTPITEPVITGTLMRNGAVTTPFVANTGAIRATLTSLTPSDAVVGFALGEWNASLGACQLRLTSDDATTGKELIGSAQVTANYCVRIYDARGDLAAPVPFEITVIHF